MRNALSQVTGLVTITTAAILYGCAGPGMIAPPAGLIVEIRPKDTFLNRVGDTLKPPIATVDDSNMLTVVSGGVVSGVLPIYCYTYDAFDPWISKVLDVKSLFFSRRDTRGCQYIAVSEVDVSAQFAKATAARSSVSAKAAATPPDQDELKKNAVTLRNSYINALLQVEDFNCRAFLGSSFQVRAVADTQKDFISSIGTGASASTVLTNPYVSGGISLANLVYGSGLDSVNKNLYLEKTSDALAAAIVTSVFDTGDTINKKLTWSYDQYPLEKVFTDVKSYEYSCSVAQGVQYLGDAANVGLKTAVEKQKQETQSNDTEPNKDGGNANGGKKPGDKKTPTSSNDGAEASPSASGPAANLLSIQPSVPQIAGYKPQTKDADALVLPQKAALVDHQNSVNVTPANPNSDPQNAVKPAPATASSVANPTGASSVSLPPKSQ